MAVSIHPAHRKMADILHNCMIIDSKGIQRYVIGDCELQLLMPLLLRNLEVVQRTDELKELAFLAHLCGDTDWEMELTDRLNQIEAILS